MQQCLSLPTRRRHTSTVLAVVAFLVTPWIADAADVDYMRDVVPILQKHCVECHGPTKQQSGLRVDAGQLLIKGGDSGPAVVPGKIDESLLIEAVTGAGFITQMPLEADPLSEAEIAVLKAWVAAGAGYPADEVVVPAQRVTSDHWSFQPIARPLPPLVENANWPRSPIDSFTLARMEEHRVAPSPRADRRTLIRRVTLDLVGLLPSPEEIDAFNADTEPGAYERLVERLLASPHFGERWGRRWLDAARYADSNGFTIDGPREIWKYRDWVIDAFNRDLPYDQFTIEQLAGDLLEAPSTDQLVATGFHRNTLANQEGGTDDEQFRNESVVDRVNTTGTVWMGLTVGCAQCHDHKYDPVSQRDYYRLFAIFNNTADNNDAGGLAPKLSLPTPAQEAEIATLRKQLSALDSERSQLEAELAPGQENWEQNGLAEQAITWQTVSPDSVTAEQGTTFKQLDDGSSLAIGDTPNSDVYSVHWMSPGTAITAIRLETLTHESLPKRGPGRAGNGNFVLSDVEFFAGEGEQPAKWLSATADHSQKNYPIAHAIDGDRQTGWAINVSSGSMNVDRSATFVLAEPLNTSEGTALTFTLRHEHPGNARYQIGRFRISVTTDEVTSSGVAPEIRKLLAIEPAERSKEQQQQIRQAYLATNPNWSRLTAERNNVDKRLKAVQKSVPTTLIMQELPQPRESYVHVRGDFLRKGAPVEPGTPAVLPPLEQETPPNRLDFARWLVSEEHPLTARVAVNQVWMRLFGRGIVGTENDFGLQGDDPTHPLLLDWLASELIRQNWSMKALLRTIVTSATYQQSSQERPDLDKIDRRNRLLARQNRIRLEAEIIRDVLLSASGLLSQRLHGPPVYPPQPDGIYVLTQTRKSWPESEGEDRFRRGLYTYFWRSSPHPLLPTFDAPDATTSCTRRTRSNTPLQALTLSNDRGLVELAQGVGWRLLREAPAGDGPRIQHLYQVCLSRPPSDAEAGRLLSFVEAQRGYFASHPEAAQAVAGIALYSSASPVEAATWVAAARVVTNLDEFITRD